MSRCWAKGSVLPRDQAHPAIDERSFRYGDGVFCSVAVRRGRLLDAPAQISRLMASATAIGIEVPETVRTPGAVCAVLSRLGAGPGTNAVARIQVSAGSGGRGYARDTAEAWELVELLPAPGRRELTVAVLREAESHLSPLPAVKSCSALPHVLFAAAATRLGVAEGIRTNDGALLEASAANLFWSAGGVLHTPSTDLPLYPGVTRAVTIEVARELGWRVDEGAFAPEALRTGGAVFLTNAARGVEPVAALDGAARPWPEELEALREAVERHRDLNGLAIDAP
jgi:branched-chain amino acid aminotransferase/4-amino-4-deoxychorismate lyase